MFHQFPLLVLYKTFRAHFLSDGKMQQGKVKFCTRASFFLGAMAAPVFIQKRTDRLTDRISRHNSRVALPAGCAVRVDVALMVFISGSDH